jgi:type II secretory pathway pseudopilin PulG
MTIRRGFTIIETILYVAILIMIMGTMLGFLVNMVRRESKVTMVMEVNQNARFAIEKINSVIRNSKDATVPADGGGSGPTLSLTMPSASLSPTVFAVTNGVLTMQQGAGAAVPLTSSSVKVASLSFTNLVDPTAHTRTDNTWPPVSCTPQQKNGTWYGVCCYQSKEYCWDPITAIFYILFMGAKLGTCLQATAAKSVIRTAITITAPAAGTVTNDYSASVTLYATSTVPRQN